MLRKLIAVVLWGLLVSAACCGVHAEEGCPPGRFPELAGKKCVPVSQYNTLPLSDNLPMRFDGEQVSMMIGWIQATGTITKSTPADFRRFLQSDDGKITKNISLHSPGGDLLAGLELGQMIRQAGMNTSIGHSISLYGTMNVYTYKNAYCLSACAYAFLGGATRSYDGADIYGIHRFGSLTGTISGDQTQVISSILAKYIQSMGVDLSIFELASTASFEKDIYRVPLAMAKQMHIIYDPSGITKFVVEQRNGIIVASFRVQMRERNYGGVITCSNGKRLLMLYDPDNSIPAMLRIAKDFPAEFGAHGRTLWGTATYDAGESSSGIPAAMIFSLPNLDEEAFASDGMTLLTIDNPGLKSITKKPDGSVTDKDNFINRLTHLIHRPVLSCEQEISIPYYQR